MLVLLSAPITTPPLNSTATSVVPVDTCGQGIQDSGELDFLTWTNWINFGGIQFLNFGANTISDVVRVDSQIQSNEIPVFWQFHSVTSSPLGNQSWGMASLENPGKFWREMVLAILAVLRLRF